MLLPVTNVTLPSDDFFMRKFKAYNELSEETLCFTAEIVHIPTGAVIYTKNEGRGGETWVDFDRRKDNWREVQTAWKNFVEACRPALVASVKGTEFDGLFDEGDNLDDSVVGLFTNEAENQQMLNRKRGLVVRTADMKDGEYGIYRTGVTVEHLKARKVKGEYWSKTEKNWVAI